VIERAIDYARQYGAKNNQLDFGLCERKESEDMPILSQSFGFYKNI
jgi:hypothetical protein